MVLCQIQIDHPHGDGRNARGRRVAIRAHHGGAHGVTAAAARIRVSPQIPDRWMIPLCMP